ALIGSRSEVGGQRPTSDLRSPTSAFRSVATALGIFSIAALQEEPRLLVAFALEVMQEFRIGTFRQLSCQRVQPLEERLEVGLGIGSPHRLDRHVQLDE